jgi:ANTAR domain
MNVSNTGRAETPTDDRAASVFTAAVAALVSSDDTVGIVTQLLLDASGVLGADGAGLVVVSGEGDVELLSSISHRAETLELFQLQADAGPCLDAIRTDRRVTATSAGEIAERWPSLADAFRATQFDALHAAPMHWRGQAIGALNLFWTMPRDTTARGSLIQAYADMATIAIMHSERLSAAQVGARTRDALNRRNIIERAKGVLAYRDRTDMQTAYHALLQLAARDGVSLSTAAETVIDQAMTSPDADQTDATLTTADRQDHDDRSGRR